MCFQLKKTIEVLEKTSVALLRFDCESSRAELKKLKEEVRDEISKLKACDNMYMCVGSCARLNRPARRLSGPARWFMCAT